MLIHFHITISRKQTLNMQQAKTRGVVRSELRGGPSHFFGRINFEPRAPKVPLVKGETFGEDLGPLHPTGSELRPAQLLRPK